MSHSYFRWIKSFVAPQYLFIAVLTLYTFLAFDQANRPLANTYTIENTDAVLEAKVNQYSISKSLLSTGQAEAISTPLQLTFCPILPQQLIAVRIAVAAAQVLQYKRPRFYCRKTVGATQSDADISLFFHS